jgi:hypothetical protein
MVYGLPVRSWFGQNYIVPAVIGQRYFRHRTNRDVPAWLLKIPLSNAAS